jgi:hypothetical protein
LQSVNQAQQVIYIQSPPQQPDQRVFLSSQAPQYAEHGSEYAGPLMQRYPSIETLAVKLNIPKLMDLTVAGITTEKLSEIQESEAVDLGISKEDYFKIKEYFVSGSNQWEFKAKQMSYSQGR